MVAKYDIDGFLYLMFCSEEIPAIEASSEHGLYTIHVCFKPCGWTKDAATDYNTRVHVPTHPTWNCLLN